MKRKHLVILHVAATIVAMLTIITFFLSSLIAEIQGEEALIRMVKTGILYTLPLLLLAMPALAMTGNQLAGKSKHPKVRQKQARMKLIMVNGIVLISLAVYLYYHANYRSIDSTFLYCQIAEFCFGLCNLTLMGMNLKTGLQLSGRLKKESPHPVQATL